MAVVIVGCDVFQPAGLVDSKSGAPQDGYLLVYRQMPKDVHAAVAALGGTVKTALADLKVVVAYGDAAFAEDLELLKRMLQG